MRTRGLLAVLLVTATGMLVTSPGATGQVPGQDSVSAIGSVVDQFGNPLPGLSISATSGASGENPTGTVTFYDGATTRQLDQLSIQTAAALIVEEPQYAKLAARPRHMPRQEHVVEMPVRRFNRAACFTCTGCIAAMRRILAGCSGGQDTCDPDMAGPAQHRLLVTAFAHHAFRRQSAGVVVNGKIEIDALRGRYRSVLPVHRR